MSLELINTLGTLTTVAIVAAAAIAALVQLRHLRAGNQINAMLSIGDKFQGLVFQNALESVNTRLAAALGDPAFRNHVVAMRRGDPSVPDVDTKYVDVRRAAILVGNVYEELGILVKNGIVDRTLFLDRYQGVIISAWHRLEAFAAFIREASGSAAIWENFEYLAVLSQDWLKQHPQGTFPKGVRRLEPHNPWPVPPTPATT
jgi:hypothetical protein